MGISQPATIAAALIAAMATPALLIVGSASLVSSAFIRLGRIVDRARILAGAAQDGSWEKLGLTSSELDAWLANHSTRVSYTEASTALLYSAIALFVAAALSIAADRAAGGALAWLPIALAIAGAILLFIGGLFMVWETHLGNVQIQDEIRRARVQLRNRGS